jgi:hypothetical protein
MVCASVSSKKLRATLLKTDAMKIAFRLLLIGACIGWADRAPAQASPTVLKNCARALAKVLARHDLTSRLRGPLDDFLEAERIYPSFVDQHEAWTVAKRKRRNAELLRALEGDWESSGGRGGRLKKDIDQDAATALTRKVERHPVVGYPNLDHYENCDQGFCFGRAVGVHVEALRERIHPDAIRKLWIIGPNTDDSFHVTTIIKAREGGWWVLDPNHETALTVAEWIQQYGGRSAYTLFVSDARRFGVQSPLYYRAVDLFGSEEEDFYNEFFSDYFSRYPL